MTGYRATLKLRITVGVILFGIAFLDADYDPFRDRSDFLNSAIVLFIIFLGDRLWAWIRARIE